METRRLQRAMLIVGAFGSPSHSCSPLSRLLICLKSLVLIEALGEVAAPPAGRIVVAGGRYFHFLVSQLNNKRLEQCRRTSATVEPPSHHLSCLISQRITFFAGVARKKQFDSIKQ